MILAAAFEIDWRLSPQAALLALGGVAMYVASRAAADALAGGDPDRPGRRALGHCLPIAITSLLFLHPIFRRPGIDDPGVGRPQIAVALLLASGVACLTLVLGIVTYLSPMHTLPASRRVWPFVLPAALLTLIAGLNGSLSLTHAGMLALLGLAVANLWLDRAPDEPRGEKSLDEHPPPPRVRRPSAWFQLALAVGLALVGAWALARATAKLEQSSRVLPGVLVAGGVLAPLLTLPVLGTASRLAERGRSDSAVTTLVAIALINLCAILPLVIVGHHLVTAPHGADAASAPTTSLDQRFNTPPKLTGQDVPYPMVAWRVDTVVLVVIGFALIPWALGRWMLTRAESIGLILAYALYLALTAFLSTLWR